MEISAAQLAIMVGILVNVFGGIFALTQLGRAVGKFEAIGAQQASEIRQLKEQTSKLATIITDLAVQSTRQDNVEKRQNRLEEDMAQLRKGEGWILPHEMLIRLAKMENGGQG